MSYEPIVTAPKDGAKILAAYKDVISTRYEVVRWEDGRWINNQNVWWGMGAPTHWKKLENP